jgi:hypothetical protein
MSPPDGITDPDVDVGASDEPSVVAAATTDDALPGVAIPGYPDLRAGAFRQGGGLLGLYRVADRPPAGDPSVLPDYVTKSWRWDDPQAVHYDLDRKRGQREQVDGMAKAAGVVADYLPMPAWASKAIRGAATVVGSAESRHIQDQIDALQARESQLKRPQGV